MESALESTPEEPRHGAGQRFRIVLAYDGRPYLGWQSQAGGGTVQDGLLAALRRLCPEVRTVQGSGRTDTGVSAAGQVAHFDAPEGWRMGGAEWQRGLNALLPATIRVLDCRPAPPGFHARYSAVGKLYRYRLYLGEVLPPLEAGLAWHRRGLDPEGLEEILAIYRGRHDFRAYSAKRHDGRDAERDTVRTILDASARRIDERRVDLLFRGDGFLYKMVRFLVGSAVLCREGKLAPETLRSWLEGGAAGGVGAGDPKRGPQSGPRGPFCAPPDGLSLERVEYAGENESFG